MSRQERIFAENRRHFVAAFADRRHYRSRRRSKLAHDFVQEGRKRFRDFILLSSDILIFSVD